MDWKIIIEAWPYFGYAQSEVAPRVREFNVKADCFDDAVAIAENYANGIQSHNKVWKANIWTVTRNPMPQASMD